jgi:hypothetical protein
MSTFINVTNGGDELLSRIKGQQQAERLAALEEAGRRGLKQELAKDAASQDDESGSRFMDPLPYHRDPAAFRLLTGGTAGVWHSWGTYEYTHGYNDAAAYLRIADPTFEKFLDWRGPDFPQGELFSAFLPLGPQTGIYIRTASDYPYYTVLTQSVADGFGVNIGYKVPINPASITKVAIVAPGSIRELKPPTSLADKMRHWGSLAYTENQWALARHFGMLRPSGGGTTAYWTPAVFSGLGGTLDAVSATDRSNYAYMRANHFGKAPGLFLAAQSFDPSVYDPQHVKWRQTKAQPATIMSPVPESSLRLSPRSYWIKLGEEIRNEQLVTADYQFYSSWDWGRESYCRQQLLSLGFTAADLVP